MTTKLRDELAALLGLIEDQIELNPSNYDHDDVCRLNTEALEIHDTAKGLFPRILSALSDAEQEREACAKVADKYREEAGGSDSYRCACQHIAETIRARGEKAVTKEYGCGHSSLSPDAQPNISATPTEPGDGLAERLNGYADKWMIKAPLGDKSPYDIRQAADLIQSQQAQIDALRDLLRECSHVLPNRYNEDQVLIDRVAQALKQEQG